MHSPTAEEASNKNSLLNDPWYAPTSRLNGRADWDGHEYMRANSASTLWKSPCTPERDVRSAG